MFKTKIAISIIKSLCFRLNLLLVIVLFSACKEKEIRQEAYAPEPVSTNDILTYLHNMLEEPALKGASFGFYVSPLEKDSSIVAYMPDISLATASTLKAITTASALNILGKDFRFETNLAYSGEIDNEGVLNGNLYLIGGGDPTFGSDNMPSLMDFLANRVIEKGIKKVNGSLIGDASIFDNQIAANTWIWEDIGNYYGVGPSGLTVHQNQYSIYFSTGSKEGDETKIMEIAPSINELTIENEVLTGKPRSGDNAYIFGGPLSYNKVVRGTLPPGHSKFMIKGAMPAPANFCTSYFNKTLEAKGITMSAPFQVDYLKKAKPTLTPIFTQESAPLYEIIKETNFKSINLYADALLKMIGHQQGGNGSFEQGILALKQHWEAKGLDLQNMIIEDGSGLSRYNAVSAYTMTQIIRSTLLTDATGSFISSLPVTGVSGTLKNINKNGISKGKIRAKSGYIKNVRAYTGTVTTYSNKTLVFSLLINNQTNEYREMTKHIEAIFNLLVRL
jgi:D-alanyl-D-alanine carboxypeptidase/D-alanyl-D-alanine-endopeptidase (penicillin-binding protein 4)